MKNRIDEAAEVIAKHTEVLGASRFRQYDKAILAARALDTDGHLLPDLPEPDGNDGIWYLHRDVIVHNGVGPCACIEDDHHIHVFKPEEGRAVAYALLAAANYAEEHTNDQ